MTPLSPSTAEESAPIYEFCRSSDGTIGRRLLFLLGQPLAGERFPGEGCECWFLDPAVLGPDFHEVERDHVADEIGDEALALPGDALETLDAEGARELSDRAPWIVDSISATQRFARAETASLRSAIRQNPNRPADRARLVDRISELQSAYRTLYALWEELRLIQGQALRRRMLESR